MHQVVFLAPPPPHLSELTLPQLLPEDQLLARELGGGDVLPSERVDGEGGHGVHVAAGHALQAHDVGLGIVRGVAMETLVGRALGDVGLGVASSTRWWREKTSSIRWWRSCILDRCDTELDIASFKANANIDHL